MRLSHSSLWEWQSAFYTDCGLDAWRSGTVPHFVTANTFIASQYARMVLGFLNDLWSSRSKYRGKLRSADPISIMEAGAGAGKFSFLMLQALWELRAFWPRRGEEEMDEETEADSAGSAAASASSSESAAASSSPPPPPPLRCPFVYIMSDVTPDIVSFWRAHPSFRPFLDRGMLDFAVLDAEHPGSGVDGGIQLLHSGRRLSAASNRNPICLIANYLFDTLRQDAFRVVPVPDSVACTAGTAPATPASSLSLQLQESLITLSSPNAYEPDLADPALIRRFRHTWSHRDVPGATVAVPVHSSAASASITALSSAAAPASAGVAATTAASSSAPVSSFEYYSGEDADLNAILRDLQTDLAADFAASVAAGLPPPSGYSVLVPVGGLRCLRYFLRLSHGNLLFLLGDKSYSSLLELQGLREPHLAVHGSFSAMVNLEVVRRWIEAARATRQQQQQQQPAQGGEGAGVEPRTTARRGGGGAALNTSYLDGFKVSAFACMEWDESAETARVRGECTAAASSSTGAASSSSPSSSASPTASPSAALFVCLLRETALAFHSLCSFGPDHFSSLQRCVKDECPAPSLKHVLSLLRLSGHDADVFWKFRQTLIDGVAGGGSGGAPSDKVLRDLRGDLQRIGRSYFPLTLPLSSTAATSSLIASSSSVDHTDHKDVSFELGRFAMSLRDYSAALGLFDASQRWFGEHAITQYNRGLSLVALARLPEAAEAFERAVQLSAAEGNTYEEATQWADRTKARIASEAEAAQLRQQREQAQQEQQRLAVQQPLQHLPQLSNGTHSRQASGLAAANGVTHISRGSFGGQQPSDAEEQQLARSYHNLPFPSISSGANPAAATSSAPAVPSEPVHPALANKIAPVPSRRFYEHHNSSAWL